MLLEYLSTLQIRQRSWSLLQGSSRNRSGFLLTRHTSCQQPFPNNNKTAALRLCQKQIGKVTPTPWLWSLSVQVLVTDHRPSAAEEATPEPTPAESMSPAVVAAAAASAVGAGHPLRLEWEYLSYMFRRLPAATSGEEAERGYRDLLQARSPFHSSLCASASLSTLVQLHPISAMQLPRWAT